MGMYSEKSQRQITKYFMQLVRRQPQWLRTLFKDDKIFFDVDPKGTLSLRVDESLDQAMKTNAATLIAKYMEKHPAEVLVTANVN